MQLYTEGAASSLYSAQIQPMENWLSIVLVHARSVLDKVKAYEIRIKYFIAEQKILSAVQISLEILKLLNVHFPSTPNIVHTLIALSKIKLQMVRTPLENLPEIKDKTAEAAIRILANVGSAVYFAKPALFPLFVCKAFSLMLKYGNSPYSGVVCSSYGVIVIGGLGKIDKGYSSREYRTTPF